MTKFIDLTDSLVVAAENDQRDVGLCGAKPLGYFGLRHRAGERSDFCDFLGSQKFLEACNSSDIDSVLPVSLIGRPFQIGRSAVSLATIDMIDDGEIEGIGNECQRHKSVDVDRFGAPISEEIDILVSEFVRAGPENLTVHSTGFQAVAGTVQTSDAAKVTYLVEIPEVCDRNRSPFFCEDDIHLAGCLSGCDGLAIKDPSRASTFGGSAIMALTSVTYNRRLPSPSH